MTGLKMWRALESLNVTGENYELSVITCIICNSGNHVPLRCVLRELVGVAVRLDLLLSLEATSEQEESPLSNSSW